MSAFSKDSIRGRFGPGIRSRGGISPGIRSEEGRFGEATSCSYHIIIGYLEGLCARKLCSSKNRMCLRLSCPEDFVWALCPW